MTGKRLYRSQDERMIAGVCGGIADYLNVDPTIVRILFVILFFLGGNGLLIYLILMFLMPVKPAGVSAIPEEEQVDTNPEG